MGGQRFKIRKARFIDHPVLGNLEFDFRGPDGEAVDTVIIAGENGTGKSTLIDALYGVMSRSTNNLGYSVQLELYREATHSWYEVLLQDAMIHNIPYVAAQIGGGRSAHLQSDTYESEFPTNAIYSDVSINFSANGITTVTSNTLDESPASRRSSEGISREIDQLLVDIQTQDDTDVATFLREHDDLTIKDYSGEERMSRFKNAFNRMFDDTKYLGIRTENGRKVIYFDKNGAKVPIDGLSSGEKQVVYRGSFMLRDSKATEGAFVFIDEPEISLHPSWQTRILDYYKSLFTNEDGVQTSQIFCVTHSPFIIHNDRRRNDKVIVVARDNSGAICIKEKPEYYRCDSMAAVKDAFDFSGFDAGSKTVFVEGQTDERYMNKAMEVFGCAESFIFREIGSSNEQGSRASGETNMQHVFEFLSIHQPPVKKAFLFDCDVKCEKSEVGNVLRLKHPARKNSKGLSKGIENALVLDNINISGFYINHEKVGPYGEQKSYQTFDKTGLCEHICGLGNDELKGVFTNLLPIIDELRGFFG